MVGRHHDFQRLIQLGSPELQIKSVGLPVLDPKKKGWKAEWDDERIFCRLLLVIPVPWPRKGLLPASHLPISCDEELLEIEQRLMHVARC